MAEHIEGLHDTAHAAASRRRTIGSLCGFGVCIALLVTPARGQATCDLKVGEMPVTMIGMRPIATVGINGHNVPLLVDSGAFFSDLTDAAAAQLGLPVKPLPDRLRVIGLTGPIDTRMTTVMSMQLLKVDIPNVDFLVGGNESGGGAMGGLGRNVLGLQDTEYDLAHGAIRLVFPEGNCKDRNMAYWAGETPVVEVPLRYDRSRWPAIKVTAKLNGVDIRAVLDTGAMSVVSLAAARRAGVREADMQPIRPIRGAGRGEAKAWVAAIDKFELGGETIANNRLTIADFRFDDVDMLLGIDFFLSHRIYVSNTQRRMFFTYNGGTVFELNSVAAEAADAAQATAAAPLADADAYARRGAASAARRDFGRALADLDRACELAPHAAEHFVRRGVVHTELQRWPAAQRDFDTALHLNPEHAEARMKRASLRAHTQDRDGALDDLRALDKHVTPQANVRLEMAHLYMSLDLPALALPQLNQWIDVHRNEDVLHGVLNSRCWVRALLGIELDQALADCNEAIKAKPDNSAFLDSRAWVRLRRGELREALADYDRALKIRPDAAWTLYGRGITRVRLGDAEQGRADLEAARAGRASIDADAGHYGLAADVLAKTP